MATLAHHVVMLVLRFTFYHIYLEPSTGESACDRASCLERRPAGTSRGPPTQRPGAPQAEAPDSGSVKENVAPFSTSASAHTRPP